MDQFGMSNLLHGVPWSLLYFIRLRWGRCVGLYAYVTKKQSAQIAQTAFYHNIEYFCCLLDRLPVRTTMALT